MSSENSELSIRDILSSVQKRIRNRNALHWATTGLALGCFCAALLACLSASPPWLMMTVSIGFGIAAGAVIGAFVPSTQIAAARLVDRFYQTKDRAVTALQFQNDDDPVRQMQVAEATRHLQKKVDPHQCVQLAANKPALYCSAAMALVAACVMLFVSGNPAGAVTARPIALAVEQAESLRETMLPELEELKQETEEMPELEELSKKLEELIEDLETESMDETDMMATLSEMQQALAEARDSLQLELTDAQLKGLADAIEPATPMQAAAAAMEAGDYENASDALEQFDPNELSDKERRAVADNLKKFLAKLPKGQQGQLCDAAQMLQEGLEDGDESQCKGGACKLAELCEKQGLCKKLGQCMTGQMNKLGQCKSACRGAGKKNGGQKVAKSDSPKNTWGRGASGKATGDQATNIDSTRREEKITGIQGDGPSESEILQAPEGEQDAARQFAKRYQKFRNEAEAVLDREPLPLGHRETVRTYFENIRPKNAEITQ